MKLAAAPSCIVDARGQPHMGRFQGPAAIYDWATLAPPFARSSLWRRFHHKRWHYVALATERLFCGIAIVDLGWTNTAFAYAFDRSQGEVVAAFSQDGVPGLTASLASEASSGSSFRFLSNRIELGPKGLRLDCGEFQVEAVFDGAPPLLLAVGPVDGGSVHATQKSGGFKLSGQVRIGVRRYELDGGVASFDYSNGLLARETAWRWASAHAHDVGFNLQAGYFGKQENALWLDGHVTGLGAAHFDYTASDPMAPWHITTDDGLLDLHFTPEGARREDKDLFVAASRYVQPIGTFDGWVKASPDGYSRRIMQLVGVTEDHASRW